MLGLIVTLAYGDMYPNLKWQKLQVNVIVLQSVGFIFMVLGNFIYNQIIKLPKMLQKDSENSGFDKKDELNQEDD